MVVRRRSGPRVGSADLLSNETGIGLRRMCWISALSHELIAVKISRDRRAMAPDEKRRSNARPRFGREQKEILVEVLKGINP